MASKSLISIKRLFLPLCSERVRHPVREGLGRRPRVCARSSSLLYVGGFNQWTGLLLCLFAGFDFGLDLDVGEIAERLVGRHLQLAVLVDALLVLLADLDLLALVGEDVDVERERLHLLQQHLEGLRNRRLGDVLALDDRLVRLDAADRVVGLDRQHLLQRVGGAVGLERPDLHLTEALAAELRLAAERLLRDERVRPGGARVDLVVHEVEQLQDVHVADGDRLLVRLARLAVEEPDLPRAAPACRLLRVDDEIDRRVGILLDPLHQGVVDVGLAGAVENRRRDRLGLTAAVLAEDAAGGGPAEVGLQNLADVHPARKAERVQDDVHRRSVLEERHVLLGDDPGDDALVSVAAGELVPLRDLALLGDVDANELVDAGREVVARLARERLHVDDLAALAVRDLKRRVPHFARLLLEDRADQLLLRRKLGLALRRYLADEQIAGADLGADAHDATLVEVLERLLRAVRNVAGDLLVTELRRAGVDLVFVNVDRGKDVLLDAALRDDDRVLEVEAFERHEGDEEVGAEGELAAVRGAAVRQNLARADAVTEADDRLLVDERALVRAHELRHLVGLVAVLRLDDDLLGVDVDDMAGLVGQHDIARVHGCPVLESGADERRLRDHQRDCLPLHVGAHQRSVRVVVLEERDQGRRDRDDLRRRDVHVIDVLRPRADGLALA